MKEQDGVCSRLPEFSEFSHSFLPRKDSTLPCNDATRGTLSSVGRTKKKRADLSPKDTNSPLFGSRKQGACKGELNITTLNPNGYVMFLTRRSFKSHIIIETIHQISL